MANTRLIALNILMRIDKDKSYSNVVIDKTLKKEALSKRDSAFVCNLVYGVLERRIQLDYVISAYSKIKLKKISPDITEILRISIYQILFMDRVPDSAAVNEAVNLTKIVRKNSAAGFVNAILRNLIRSEQKFKLPNKNKDFIEYLSVKYSCPEDLVEFFRDSYGEDSMEELLSSLLERPPIIARVNTLKNTTSELIEKLASESVDAVPCIVEDAIEISDTGDISRLNSFKDGCFHIQDLASQVLCKIINPKPGQTVVDVCAAPGGKSFTMAELMCNRGKIFSYDLYDQKIKLIEEGARRLGISIINADKRDAMDENSYLKKADIVLCDVPCSGLGIIRRKPEIKYNSLKKLDILPDLQYRILCNSEKFTKAGGLLVYSTCTLNPKENGDIANRFLRENKNYEPVKIAYNKLNRALNEPENQLTFLPYSSQTDGFFISTFRKLR